MCFGLFVFGDILYGVFVVDEFVFWVVYGVGVFGNLDV